MAYADQQMSGNRITAFIVVALLHVFLGYALVTGLAYDVAKKVVAKVTTIDIEEEVKKEEPPPPPPKKADLPPPPIVAPPPKVNLAPAPSNIETVSAPPPVAPPPTVFVPPPPSAPAAPRIQPKSASPRGNPGNWATTNDYPSRALREEREGVTGFRVTIGTDGRVTNCAITSSSGHSDLDEATCTNVTRRARFNVATDGEGQPTTGSYSGRVRWVIPKE